LWLEVDDRCAGEFVKEPDEPFVFEPISKGQIEGHEEDFAEVSDGYVVVEHFLAAYSYNFDADQKLS
jgi:hypothetical protein